jgi:hypothetical protein
MVRDALERERARIQSDDEERREDLERLRTTMASALPDEVWSELGVDPKSAVLTRAQSGHERLTTEASVNLEGEEIEVSAVMAADSSRRRVAKPLLVALYAAGRKVELPSVAEGDDAASIPGENARSVGRLLLAALRNRREERREEYRAKLYEIQTRIEGACESGRLATCEEWITGVRDEDKERLVSLARSRTEELKNKEDEERRRAEADKLEKIAAVAEARKLHEEHGAEWERYEKEARKWAEEQTFHLFRPWKRGAGSATLRTSPARGPSGYRPPPATRRTLWTSAPNSYTKPSSWERPTRRAFTRSWTSPDTPPENASEPSSTRKSSPSTLFPQSKRSASIIALSARSPT